MVQGSFPFLPLPSIFLRTPRPYGEARHFFANKPRARFWQRNNCCQLGRDIVPPRCETAASFFQGILAYLYPSLPRIRIANRYEEREIDLSSFRSDATLDTTTKTKILRIRSRCLEENLKRTVVRVAIPTSTMGPIHFERFWILVDCVE